MTKSRERKNSFRKNARLWCNAIGTIEVDRFSSKEDAEAWQQDLAADTRYMIVRVPVAGKRGIFRLPSDIRN